MLEGADRPVRKAGELLGDGLDPDLQQRELAAHIADGELRGILERVSTVTTTTITHNGSAKRLGCEVEGF